MNEPNFSGNVGEWSEAYVLLRLLADGKLVAAGPDLVPDPDLFFPVVKVIRRERPDKTLELAVNKQSDEIDVIENGALVRSHQRVDIAYEAVTLGDELKNAGKKSKLKFPRTECFLTDLGCETLKAPSADKTDITLQLHDPQTGYESITGFSIKSQLGSAPTLLNASGATNFTFKISGLDDEAIASINAIEGRNKISQRMEQIFAKAESVVFAGIANSTFEKNLLFIDNKMPEIMSEFLKVKYRDHESSLVKAVETLEKDDPLDFQTQGLYRHKIKKLLCAIALGLQPSKPWNGRDEANGGYIIITAAGDVVAYHIYNRDDFEDYLLQTTKFDTASTTRHNYASLYKKNDEVYINLNLQIRFESQKSKP